MVVNTISWNWWYGPVTTSTTLTGLETKHVLGQAFSELGIGLYHAKLINKFHLEGYGGLAIGVCSITYTLSPSDKNYVPPFHLLRPEVICSHLHREIFLTGKNILKRYL